VPIRYVGKQLKRFFVYRVLHVDDTPHRIALGVAIGIFVTWTPTIGFQMILTVALAALLRANKAVGVPFVWISNPVTLVPVYGPNYWVGTKLLGHNYDAGRFTNFVEQAMKSGTWLEHLSAAWSAMCKIFWPLWVGSIAVGLGLAVISYFGVRFAVVRYRRWWRKHHETPPWSSQEPATPPADEAAQGQTKPDDHMPDEKSE